MDGRRALEAVLRRWWMVMGLPLVVLVGTLATASSQPYVAGVRAAVVMPGDTEDPGNAERPELMVMDDLRPLMASAAFARDVAAELPARVRSRIDAAAVQASLTATTKSRILTVEAERDDADDALNIARAVQQVLPTAVNQYLVSPTGQQATVNIIDPATRATRGDADRALVIVVQTVAALIAGLGIAAVAGMLDERLYTRRDVEGLLGLPVLADLRASCGHRLRHGTGSLLQRIPTWHR